MKCIFEKNFKKTKRGVFAVFWNQISEKSEGGTLLQKNEGGKNGKKAKGPPFADFFEKNRI